MKKFTEDYVLIEDMVDDDYYPEKCVEKVKKAIEKLIDFLEDGHTDVAEIQEKLDEMTHTINDLEDDFEKNESEIETVARDSIGITIEYILNFFEIDIDIETAIRERDW